MKTQNYKSENGGTVFNIMLVLLLAAIGVLIYLLAGGTVPKTKHNTGVVSPTMPTPVQDTEPTVGFSDNLKNPNTFETFDLNEFGEGTANIATFNRDLNEDGRPDCITRTRVENGTAHFYYEYKIELNDDGYMINITPDGFRTTEGIECSLQKLKFIFEPDFRVIKISRPWQESWSTPTMATKTTYALVKGKLQEIDSKPVKEICDVSELF